jgi:nicotinate dehydrogenase subunit B
VVDVAPDTPLREGLRDALDAWIRINADGTVMVFTGKVEIGQSIKTALAQVAAEELDVSLDRHRQVGGHV